jgi:xylan 1,4-beta-xylosidase
VKTDIARKSSWKTSLWLAAVLLSLLAAPLRGQEPSDQPAAAQRQVMEMVRIAEDGQGFVLADSKTPFVPWGFNFVGKFGQIVEEYWEDDWPSVEEDFRRMRDLGANVVRLHLQVGTYMKTAEEVDAEAIKRLRRMLDLARDCGLYLKLTGLGCYHLNMVPAWYDKLSEADRWQVQARFWEAIAQACAGHPAVFCYDLMNEPVITQAKEGEHPWLLGELEGFYFVQRISNEPGGRTSVAIAEAWVKKLTDAIRKHDRNGLVTVGVIPWAQVFPGAKPLFYAPEVARHLDFVSVHFYPKSGEVDKALTALAVYDIGKPMVVGEIFPLSCTLEELDQFIDGASDRVDGWISHYFGHSIEEHAAGAKPGGKPVAEFLKYWREKGARQAEHRKPQITIQADEELGELYNFWRVFPVTIQAPFKDSEKHAELRRLYPFAKVINCVRFLGGIDLEKDDYFRGVATDGQAICDFTEAIELLSGIRKCGLTPWIVLDNVPAAMSEKPVKNKYGNTEPPADFQVWTSYVRQLVQSLVDHFGRDEVNEWRFRVGTEPDLAPGHWSGTKEQYFEHYDHTVAAVLSVLPDADIGPGNILDPVKNKPRGAWGLEIIDHCATGRNHATGETGTPMKFFASSYYTAVGVSDERFETVIQTIRDKLAQYPQFARVPVEIHEFGILSEGGKLLAGDGTEFGGSWAAHMARKIYAQRIPNVYQWHWNTTKAGGIPIPVTHVLQMLEGMVGGRWLSATTSREDETDDIGCIACRTGDVVELLIYRHLATRDNGNPVQVQVVLDGKTLAGKQWTVTQGSLIDREHSGFAHEQAADMEQARQELGEDASALAVAMRVMARHREKYERMSQLSQLETLPELSQDGTGRIRFDVVLSGHHVVHLRLRP